MLIIPSRPPYPIMSIKHQLFGNPFLSNEWGKLITPMLNKLKCSSKVNNMENVWQSEKWLLKVQIHTDNVFTVENVFISKCPVYDLQI